MAYWLRAQDYGRTTLSEAVDADDTTLRAPLADHGRFPAASGGDDNFIVTLWDSSSYRTPLEAFEADDLEQVLVTTNGIGVDPETFEPVITNMIVTRGYGDTTPQAWPAGTALWLCDNAAVISEIQAALDAHTHTGGAQKVGASALAPVSVAATDFVTAASYMTAATYLQVGAYLKGYNDASALYSGSTGGVLELTQGAPSGATARSKVLMWCRDGIVGGVQAAFGPVHANADASFNMVLFPKGTPAGGTAFSLFGNGSATRWANFYCTTTDAGIAVQTGITTLSFRNGHAVTDPLSMQLDLVNDLLTFAGDAIIGRSAANEITVGTVAAPDNLKVTKDLSVDGTSTLTGATSFGDFYSRRVHAWALTTLVDALMSIGTCVAVWVVDRNGTSLIDWIAGRNGTFGTSYTVARQGMARYVTVSSNSGNWSVADADAFSFGNGTTDSPFSVCSLCYPTADSLTRLFWGRYDTTTGATKREARIGFNSTQFLSQLYDESTGGWIGRLSDSAVKPTLNQWGVYTTTYSGSSTAGGISIYSGATRVDTTDSVNGSYTAMENTDSAAGPFYKNTSGDVISFQGRQAVTVLFGEELSEASVARVNWLLSRYVTEES